jgi:hypothetical protein
MQNMPSVPIDWASVNWLYVAVLAAFVFFSTLIGSLLTLKRAVPGAVLSALLFSAAFVFWTYYPHGLPLPTSVAVQKAPVRPVTPAAPPAPAVPAAPSAPVTPLPPPPSSPPSNSQ